MASDYFPTELYRSKRNDEFPTPQDFFDELDAEFHFDLDPCSTDENAKCERHFTREHDGLKQGWTGRVWMNPPYGRECGKWVKKAFESVYGGVRQNLSFAYFLLARGHLGSMITA